MIWADWLFFAGWTLFCLLISIGLVCYRRRV